MLRNPTRGGLIIARTCIRLSLYLAVVLAASGLGRAAGEKVRPAPLVRVAPGSIEPGTPAAARSGGRSGASARAMAPIPIEKISFDAVGLAPGSHANVPSLFDRYQEALAHETRRSLRRDPSMLWIDPISADEDQHRRYRQRRAEKIFGKANNVLLKSLAD
ncbi:MAG: hypothetical protein ACE5HU_06885, partial [Acidobacteriota bacterium]